MKPTAGFPALALAVSAALMLAAAVAGCASPRLAPGENLYVYVSENARITFDGEPVAMNDLPERLRKAGATPDTPIVFKTQGNVPGRMMRSLVSTVQAKGYTRVVFETPKMANAFVPGTEGAPAPDRGRSPRVRPSPRNVGTQPRP